MAGSPADLLAALLNLIFPIRCVGCGLRGTSVCAACWPLMPWLGTEVCPLCAVPDRRGRICRQCREGRRALDGSRAACRFDGIARTAIHDLKYRGVRGRAALLGQVVAEVVEHRPLAVDLLVPVPLSAARRRARGFNQSDLIASQIGVRLGLPVLASCLERTRDTPSQVGRSADERRENVRGAFRCREPAAVAGKRVALVDDVMTTGATLSSAAAELKVSGAARVYGLVVAREA